MDHNKDTSRLTFIFFSSRLMVSGGNYERFGSRSKKSMIGSTRECYRLDSLAINAPFSLLSDGISQRDRN